MSQDQPRLVSLDHLVLTVADIPATLAFYTEVLGMTVQEFTVADGSTRQALRFGMSKINLHQRGAEFEPKASKPTPGSADLCFITDQPTAAWIRHLSHHGIAIEEGPVPRSGATGPLTSIYLRDPDQNLIEIATQI
ncbi:Glyoxalase family protein [Sulfitobacter noctilucae]|uniref:VOC family protein n=1 Tax=Sulfitobacter noctilucae TaxID=1342302 RepID=UPI00046B03CB|nr:VOC family protein [Sulfitobacter noctilucae]KIN65448.1 Glyoxalase family protein [Sulfitobacter noctilucae]